jgi:Kef-type K+ transport system membrane component KefB
VQQSYQAAGTGTGPFTMVEPGDHLKKRVGQEKRVLKIKNIIIMAQLIAVIIALAIAVAVAKDASKRGMNGLGWGIGVFLIMIIFLPLYFILRKPKTIDS